MPCEPHCVDQKAAGSYFFRTEQNFYLESSSEMPYVISNKIQRCTAEHKAAKRSSFFDGELAELLTTAETKAIF